MPMTADEIEIVAPDTMLTVLKTNAASEVAALPSMWSSAPVPVAPTRQ